MSGRRIGRFAAGLLTIVFFVNISGAAHDTNHVAGVALLQKGDYSGALKRLEKAYRTHPADARIAFDYARVAPCSLAVAIYTKLASETKAPDSLRAAAYIQLGDYSFVHSAFKTAAEKYRLASTIVVDPYYLHLQAIASAAAHDTATARSIWHGLIGEAGGDLAQQAYYQLGLLDMKAGAFDSAYIKLLIAGALDSTRSWTIAATVAKLECALKLGKQDSVNALEKRLQPFRERLLEKDLLNLAGILIDKKPSSAAVKAAQSGETVDSTVYTLQVGAFGSLDNASSLQKKLEQRFGEVSIMPVTLSDQVFYRVRIGTFKSKDRAEAFGGDSLAPAGISSKAVVK